MICEVFCRESKAASLFGEGDVEEEGKSDSGSSVLNQMRRRRVKKTGTQKTQALSPEEMRGESPIMLTHITCHAIRTQVTWHFSGPFPLAVPGISK
jgi:hypothetical protein